MQSIPYVGLGFTKSSDVRRSFSSMSSAPSSSPSVAERTQTVFAAGAFLAPNLSLLDAPTSKLGLVADAWGQAKEKGFSGESSKKKKNTRCTSATTKPLLVAVLSASVSGRVLKGMRQHPTPLHPPTIASTRYLMDTFAKPASLRPRESSAVASSCDEDAATSSLNTSVPARVSFSQYQLFPWWPSVPAGCRAPSRLFSWAAVWPRVGSTSESDWMLT